MAHPLRHAESSARKFGGTAGDYLPIHNWFDEPKAFFPWLHLKRPEPRSTVRRAARRMVSAQLWVLS